MTSSLASATFAAPFHPAQRFRESSNLHQDLSIADGTLDGSIGQLTRFLRELIEMTGQEAGAVPVLELQFGEILTTTTIQTDDGNCLLITALLPKCRPSPYLSQAAASHFLQNADDIHYLWHADEGRYIGLRRIQISGLNDERSVMDAIMATADQAANWFSTRRGGKPLA
jgi:hypothetical protein